MASAEFKLLTTTEELNKPILWNAEEIKNYVTEVTSNFATLEYSEEQEREAKADRANLNKLKNALKQAKKSVKEQHDLPYEVFAAEVDEAIKILDETIAHIDAQTAEMDSKRRKENLEKAKTLYDMTIVSAGLEEWLPWEEILALKATSRTTYEDVFGNKTSWTNAEKLSEAGAKVVDIFVKLMENVQGAIDTVKAIHSKFENEALTVLKETRSTEKAFAEIARLQAIEDEKQKAIEEAKRQAELEAQKKIEEERRRAEAEKQRLIEEEHKKAEEEKRLAIEAEQAKAREEAERIRREQEAQVRHVSFDNVECPVDEQKAPEPRTAIPRQEADSMLRQEGEDRQWIAFKAFLSIPQALELKNFFNERGIEFGPAKLD